MVRKSGQDEAGRALDLLREGLGPFVTQQLANNPPPAERLADFVRSNSWLERKDIRDWDVAALLKFMQFMWHDVFRHVLSRSERAFATELQGWRNKWAHQEHLPIEDIDRALDSAARLLRAVDAEPQAAEVAQLRKHLAEPRRTYVDLDATPQIRVPSSPQPKPLQGSQADTIRQFAMANYVLPWRKSGADVLTIRAGDLGRKMGLRNATPNVCSALEGGKFLALANLVLVRRDGPHRSTTTTYHFRAACCKPP